MLSCLAEEAERRDGARVHETADHLRQERDEGESHVDGGVERAEGGEAEEGPGGGERVAGEGVGEDEGQERVHEPEEKLEVHVPALAQRLDADDEGEEGEEGGDQRGGADLALRGGELPLEEPQGAVSPRLSASSGGSCIVPEGPSGAMSK